MTSERLTVIGAGLAGCEAAWQAAECGVPVDLYEMKPTRMSPAHHKSGFAELVCSNSFRSNQIENAVGLLKEEMRRIGSLVLTCADQTSVPAGGALAVDRDEFSDMVTLKLSKHPLICIFREEIKDIPTSGTCIIATGPLTDDGLFDSIQSVIGRKFLHFFDAAAPIVQAEGLDMSIVFAASRYDKGGADYLNCPMNESEYRAFYDELVNAELGSVKDFDKETVFEGCMPIETMAKRGFDTIRFGPLKPVGLTDPRTGRTPYACVQLRRDDRSASLYNMVGFQTRLKYSEQERVFRMIPGLHNANFSRFGVMHRNTYLQSPELLTRRYSLKNNPNIFFAGQITGVEGYVESAGSGLLAGIYSAGKILKKEPIEPISDRTVLGAMAAYISDPQIRVFQPMNANFGIIPALSMRIRNKKEKNLAYAERSLAEVSLFRDTLFETMRKSI